MNEAIIEQIRTLTEPLLEGSDMFIVNVRIKPTNNIKLYLDADSGLNISKSASVNRKLAALIEESGMFPDGDFSLEVSSPGVDEPLVSMRQYKKNVGRTVLITYNNEETPETLGVLKEVTEDEQQVEIPVSDIKKTVVQIIF
jgi:ribosome maturation factor RimP